MSPITGTEADVPYSAEVSRATPSCFLFVIDQSGSMSDPFAGSTTGRSKAQELADVINRLLQTLVTRCAKGEDVRDYFDVGVIGYGQGIGHGLQGVLAGRDFVPISQIAFNPVRLENRSRKVPDGAGGLVEESFQFPVWFDPVHNCGTPMCDALGRAKAAVESWSVLHSTSYPPTVIHVTDGESTDGDPSPIAQQIRSVSTADGPVCLYNLHLSSTPAKPITFPASEAELPDEFARLLFSMSTPLQDRVRREAATEGYAVSDGSRGFAFNADLVEAIRFIDIGTRVSGLR
jgi:hypothetical protein